MKVSSITQGEIQSIVTANVTFKECEFYYSGGDSEHPLQGESSIFAEDTQNQIIQIPHSVSDQPLSEQQPKTTPEDVVTAKSPTTKVQQEQEPQELETPYSFSNTFPLTVPPTIPPPLIQSGPDDPPQDLFKATKGFRDKELLGTGGFGMVYRGVLPSSKIQVAVKRVSHKSKQGMREFIAEIVSLGRLRHRNLVQLLGYCRRKGELLLVYDFMPNGSLDKCLFDQPKRILNWHQRFRIIKGVASGILYLHEGWEQVVLHRDIKASNVILDGEFNGRLGDFGLARLYDHGTNPHTTHVVGTLGYIAPELTRTGKATTSTDVFAFGAFMLEVACGKRPIGLRESLEEMILVDWVLECWKRGEILEARDVRLGNEYVKEEMELVLKLGLLCSHPMAAGRPSMRQVMQFLDGDCPMPEFSSSEWNIASAAEAEMLKEMGPLYPFSITMEKSFFGSSSSYAESNLSGGR
ncbi:hypothetical protein MRB53_010942 [Persea americana]|uniref:Uncharacterized protein n=1 Tax=Persea americana TaxID=3435 RepID=A0ACC2LTF9_PERAE|nr:hypothetical protein MRB53_010942 [Persea americana]